MNEALMDREYAEPIATGTGASSVVEGRYAAPPEDKRGKQWVRTSVLVQADPMTLYTLWRDVDKASLWQETIIEARSTSDKTSHWTMSAGDKNIQWDSEVLNDEPGKRIAWRSIAGDLENAGEVMFEPSPGNRGTQVTLLQEFGMSKLASAWRTLVDHNPKQAIIESLRNFKALAETGEIPRSHPQPHGERGIVGKVKRSMYGEQIPVPTGTRDDIDENGYNAHRTRR